jgi:hypothetical protein
MYTVHSLLSQTHVYSHKFLPASFTCARYLSNAERYRMSACVSSCGRSLRRDCCSARARACTTTMFYTTIVLTMSYDIHAYGNLLLFFFFFVTDACSSRSTPKPRPLQPTARPNITFHTYPCPSVYAKWYCLNEATCFAIKIGESLLYNCEWVWFV